MSTNFSICVNTDNPTKFFFKTLHNCLMLNI